MRGGISWRGRSAFLGLEAGWGGCWGGGEAGEMVCEWKDYVSGKEGSIESGRLDTFGAAATGLEG